MATKSEQQKNDTGNATGTATAKGPRILKHGLLAAPCTIKVSGPAKQGNYGKLDIPLTIDGQRFILPLAPQNPEFDTLRVAFGEPSEWEGCSVTVSDGKMLRQVSIKPAFTRDGKPVS